MRDPLLHPVVLISMLILGVNDHWAKAVYPGLITGKVSDIAGLAFFPVLVELFLPPRLAARQRRQLAVTVTGIGFFAVKVLPAATALWNQVFGALYRATGWATGSALVCDPTDLMACSILVVPLLFIPLRGAS
jgi:hypothetical protein